MKAVVLYGPKNVALGDLPAARLKDDEIRISVAYCGICGSDHHKVAGKKNTHPVTYPVALGHEISGVVSEVGSRVNGFAVGDRVTVDPNWSCGKCSYCQEGLTAFCENARGVVKGMAEYVVSPQANVYHLPASLSLRDAALTEPLSCCLHGMDLLGLRGGERVALIGFGAIGAIMLQLIRLAGAGEIVVFEPDEAKREKAIAMGATHFISSTSPEEIEAFGKTHPIHRVMECVGISKAQETAIRCAGKGATVVFFGVSDEADRLSLSVYEAFTKELTIKTSFINPHTTRRAIELLASGKLDTQAIITAELSAEEAVQEFLTPFHSRKGKVLVRIHGEES